MSILTASNLSQSFGAFDLFKGISVAIANDSKIGLVGPNGIGKTSLLLMLSRQAPPSGGAVHWARGIRLGYLPQEAAQAFAGQHNTVYEEMLTLFADLRAEEARLRQMEIAMETGDFADALFESYSRAQEQFELSGGYDYEVRIKQVLTGLGFKADSYGLPLDHLSGGQKTRLLLARLLLEKPDLLILDEPTNHLDVEAIEWLEKLLSRWPGAILVVSHDRYFLDRVVNTIWEMSRTGIELYRGNYSAYVQQRQERWERRLAEFQTFRDYIEKELDYIRRNIAGQRTLMAQGKLKRITRELKAVEMAGLQALQELSWGEFSDKFGVSGDEWGVAEATAHFKGLRPPAGRPPKLNLKLKAIHRSGNIVLRTRRLVVGYPGKSLFQGDDIELTRLECAALIGSNGTGKTTFLKTILEQLAPVQGEVVLGASLKIGYFAQAHSQLNPERTVLEALLDFRDMPISEARNYLAQYLFQHEDVFKPIRALSGGERGRLALALLALEGANFLLLDEPTNHLDIPAQEILQEVLEHFEGTILLVSHDRYLVDRLATQIWELRSGRLRVFKGSYQELLAAQEAPAGNGRPPIPPSAKPALNDNPSKNELKRRQVALAKLENEIHLLEKQQQAVAEALQQASEAQHFDNIQSLSLTYATIQTQLDTLLQQWEITAHEQAMA